MSGMILSAFGFYNLNKELAINFGLDVPLHLSPATSQFYAVIRCDILYNF